MPRLVFEPPLPVAGSQPDRADVAAVVGLVRPRPRFLASMATAGTAAAGLGRWLREHGYPPARVQDLDDVPVPVESWSAFEEIFAWDERPLDDQARGLSYLGVSVRSFFAEGGRKCYVVPVAAPLAHAASADARGELRLRLCPANASPVDRATWRGAAHLFGLPEVSFLLFPDLPELVADPPPPPAPEEPAVPEGPEPFVECSAPAAPPPRAAVAPRFFAPRASDAGFAAWAATVRQAGKLIERFAREVQLVTALPLPLAGGSRLQAPRADRDLLGFLREEQWLSQALVDEGPGIASAFVQLVHPWIATSAAPGLPEGIQPACGAVAGLLARNALLRGTYRSAADLKMVQVQDIAPFPPAEALDPSGLPPSSPQARLIDRVSVVGPSPAGFRLLSDVTTSLQASYRPAHVNRLLAAVLRAARRLGEDALFEPSGPALWAGLRDRLRSLLIGLWRAGALRGATEAEAFAVACDRTTMTQQDLDQGRLIATIQLTPVQAIERITVALVLEEQGATTLEEAA